MLKKYAGPGLDWSCLSTIAAGLPKLTFLRLSLLACDTSDLPEVDQNPPKFGAGCEFSFPLTFSNFARPGFDVDKAVQYCANLITIDPERPPEPESHPGFSPFVPLNNRATRETFALPEWRKFFVGCDKFTSSFSSKLRDLLAERRTKPAESA